MKWHTRQERKVIKKYGGIPLQQYGPDGEIKGRPVEVRAVRTDDRFRIQQDVHKELLARHGSYIFCDGNQTKRLGAGTVSDLSLIHI